MTDPTTPDEWLALYRSQGIPDDLALAIAYGGAGDVVATDDPPIERAAARALIARAALDPDTIDGMIQGLKGEDRG